MSTAIERGDVYWTALDPVIGSELAKTRPCVVVSATEVNTVRRTVVIVPLTTTSAPPSWPLLIELPTFTAKTRARIEQVRVIDKTRLRQRIDTMDDERAIQSGVAVLAERIGMLADLGAGRLGQPAVLGGVANWAMPYIRDWPDGPPGALAAQVGEG